MKVFWKCFQKKERFNKAVPTAFNRFSFAKSSMAYMTHPTSRKKSLFYVVTISYEFAQCDLFRNRRFAGIKYKHEGPSPNLITVKKNLLV